MGKAAPVVYLMPLLQVPNTTGNTRTTYYHWSNFPLSGPVDHQRDATGKWMASADYQKLF